MLPIAGWGDAVIAGATLTLACVALLQWICSTKAHKQSHRPIVKSDLMMPVANAYGWVKLTNSGLGPALIEEINLYIDGKKVDGTLQVACTHIIQTIGMRADVPLQVAMIYAYQEGYPIGRDETIPLVEFYYTRLHDDKALWLEIERSQVQIEVLYRDIFGKSHVSRDPQPDKAL